MQLRKDIAIDKKVFELFEKETEEGGTIDQKVAEREEKEKDDIEHRLYKSGAVAKSKRKKPARKSKSPKKV